MTNLLVRVLANAAQTSQYVSSKRSTLLKGCTVSTEPYPTRANVHRELRYLRALHARCLLQGQRTTQWSLTEHAERGLRCRAGRGGRHGLRARQRPLQPLGTRPQCPLRTATLSGARMCRGAQLQPARVPPGK